MYHEVTYKQEGRLRRRCVAVVVAVALSVALAWLALGIGQETARASGAVTLHDSIVATALKCYAVEGSYPTSLGYLERQYGLSVNHDAYHVSYEWLGDNVLPSVVVTANG